MNITVNQVRSVIAKLCSLSFYGDQTKTASELSQVKQQLVSFLKKANELSRADIKHLQRVVNTYEESFFHIIFLVLCGVDFDDLSQRQFDLMLATKQPKKYIELMDNFDILDRLFIGTGINDSDDRMKEAIKLYRTSRRKFSLKSLIRGLDRSQLSVGGMPVQEFLVTTVLDVITGDVHTTTGDDYLKSLGLIKLRKIKGRSSLLARLLTTSINSYEKRASLTEEEQGQKHGNWNAFFAKFVGRFQFIKRTIKDFTISRMGQESSTSVPVNLSDENWNAIYDSITEMNLGDGDSDLFLDEYRNRGLDSKMLRDTSETLLDRQKAGTLSDEDVPRIMGVAFVSTKRMGGPQGAELIRYALDNIEHVSSTPSVQVEMRKVAYQRLFQLGRLTKRELGFLDTTSLEGEVESHALKAELKKRLNLKGLDALFTAFKDKGNSVIKNSDGDFVLVNAENQPFFSYGDDLSDDLKKATRALTSMPAMISDKAGIGAYKLVEELVSFFNLVERSTELAFKRLLSELVSGGRKKNKEALSELESLDVSDIVVSVGASRNLNLDLGTLLSNKDECEEILAKKTISDHPLSSLSSTDYMHSPSEGKGGAQFAGSVTNVDMSRFSQLRRALLESDQYKDDMKELDDYRIYIQKASQALSASISFPYEKSSGKFRVKKADQNLDAIKAFLGDLERNLDIRSMPEPPSFLNTQDMDKFELGFLEAVGEATKLHEATDYDNLPSDFEDKVNKVLTDILTEYNEYSADFPQNYKDAVGVIVESDSDGQFNDAYKSLQAQIVRDAIINELAPSSRRGSNKYPSQKRALRAKTLGLKIGMSVSNIIESVMGVDKKGPVITEESISKSISDAKKKWSTATEDFEVGVASEIERLLKEGDFLVSDARLSKAIKNLKKPQQNKVQKAFGVLRDAIAADVLTDYAERARLRAKLEVGDQINTIAEEVSTLKQTIEAKSSRQRTDEEKKILADIAEGNHSLQEKIGELSQGRNRKGQVAAQASRERRKEDYQSPYSVRVDEIIRETDLDVSIKKSKVREAEDRLRKNVQKMNENMASLPSIDGKNSNTNTRVLADISMASILANQSHRKKVGKALVSADIEKVIDFVFAEALADCFPTLRDNPEALIKRFKGFMDAFGLTRRFFDSKSGTVYSPNIANIFGDASASSITDYAGDFLKFLQTSLSKELMEYVYTNSIDSERDDEGELGFTTSTGHYQIYEALGIEEEVMERIGEIANPTDEEGYLTGITPEVSDALRDLRDQLRNNVLNIGDYVPSDRLETGVKISNTPTDGSALTLGDLEMPQAGKSNKPREDLIQITKSFIHGTMLLGGLYVSKADDALALSLGIDPQCLEDFAKVIGLEEDS